MHAESFRIRYQDTFFSVDSELGKAQQGVSSSLLKAAEPGREEEGIYSYSLKSGILQLL